MNRKIHFTCVFQDGWLSNEKYRKWIRKSQNKKEARCFVCNKNLDISAMGSSTLDSHASGKKHQQLMLECSKSGVIDLMFNKPCSSSTKETEDSKRSGSLDDLLLKNEVINAELLWCLKLVTGHLIYNLCSNISEIFKIMFSHSDVARQFSLGNTKVHYMILYGIAPYCKAELLGQINSSPQFSLSFDESLNTALQKCQMDANIRFFNNNKYGSNSVFRF